MLFGANKCCGCCCIDGHIDRTKNGQKCCEEAGGEWIACPEAIICACECIPSATVNDVVVAPGAQGFPATFTFLGAEPVTPQGGFTTVEWRFWAVVDAACFEGFPPFYLLRVTLYVQLWCDGGNVSEAAGFFGYQAGIWEFLFTQTAKFDDHPNKWPCVQSLPTLNIGPDGPDAAAVATFFANVGFGIAGWGNNWDVEYENVAAPYFAEPTEVSLECTWSPPCE